MNAAIVIGCSRYDDREIADLKYAHLDAKRVGELLMTTCGVSQETMLLLSNDSSVPELLPTRSNIIRILARSAFGRLDTLFFFFSGHGFRAPDEDVDYLLVQDTVPADLEETAISFELARKYLQRWGPTRVALFLDACRAVEDDAKSITLRTREVGVAPLYPALMAFSSCHPLQRSYEVDELEGGIFTRALCDGLGDVGRCKTAYELEAYLAEHVPALARRHGKPVQEPYPRVEGPEAIWKTPLVSEPVLHARQAQTPLGVERRAPYEHRPPRPTVKDVVCAVDFGTSFSAIAFLSEDEEEVELAPAADARRLVPSVVVLSKELDYVVGWPAVAASHDRPEATLRAIKRRLGSDESWDVDGVSVSPEYAASLVLRSLRRNTEEYLRTPVSRVLVSAPANFSIRQTNALVRAFQLADFEICRVITEPAAAALLVADRVRGGREDEVDAVVVDLGGGTFDVCTVSVGTGDDPAKGVVVELKEIAGDDRIGGLDYDDAVAEYIREYAAHEHGDWGPTAVDLAQIQSEAERVKVALGVADETTVVVRDLEVGRDGLTDVAIPVTRELFRSLTRELNERVAQTLAAGTDSWSLKYLNLVLNAGQGSKIFTVVDEIARAYPHLETISLFQETAVVRGLARYLPVFSANARPLHEGSLLLLDGVPTTIGVRCASSVPGGYNQPAQLVVDRAGENPEVCALLPAATTIPTRLSAFASFTGSADAPFALEVVERRGHDRGDESELCRIDLGPGAPEGARVELEVDVDANRTIVLSVVDEGAGEVTPYQLNNHFLEPYLRDRGPLRRQPLVRIGVTPA